MKDELMKYIEKQEKIIASMQANLMATSPDVAIDGYITMLSSNIRMIRKKAEAIREYHYTDNLEPRTCTDGLVFIAREEPIVVSGGSGGNGSQVRHTECL